jgi:glycosyltransferase 2 family protein
VLIALALTAPLAYVAVALLTDAKRLGDALRTMGWAGCTIVLALSFVNYLLRFQRWKLYLAIFGRRPPSLLHLLYYLSGFAFTVSPGKAGEAVRSVYLRAHDVPYAQSMAALFVERLLDVLAMVLLASMLVLSHPPYRPLILGVLSMTLIVLLVVSRQSSPRLLDAIVAHRSGRIGQLLRAFAELLRASSRLLHWQPLLIGLLLGLISWGAEGLGFGLICSGLSIEIDKTLAMGIYAVALLAGSAAFFLPAGIGGAEAVMTSLLVEQGAPVRVALIATVLCRLATLWFAVLLGLIATSMIEIRHRTERQRVTS